MGRKIISGRKLGLKKITLPFFLFLFIFIYLPAVCASHHEMSINSPPLWETARQILYSGHHLWNLNSSDSQSSSFLKNGIIDTSLPGGSHLTVRGRKVIGIKYTHFDYLDPRAEKDRPTSTTEIEQQLQVQARGKVGEKISVNVDYDDTAPRAQQQKINLLYRGDEHELIQEAALGDIHLALPKTHFTSYSKSLFGARLKARWGNFHLTGIGSVTKGISEVKTFTGKTTSEEREIHDTGYIKRTYFKLFFDQEYPPELFGHPPFSYTPGSVEVWIDDKKGSNNVSGVTTQMEVMGEQIDAATDEYTGWFDPQYPGQDYTIDYSKGVIKFNKSIGEQYIIAIAYKKEDGTRHPPSGYRMIMKGLEENYDKYYQYRIWNYYYLGSKKIREEDFVFQIKDLAGEVVYDWELKDEEEYPYEVDIDFDFGIAQIISSATADTYYRPFPEAYPPDSTHQYTLHTEYIHTVDAYILHPDIIPGSERVYVDGKLLTKDEDYTIDYPSGYLTFMDPELIGPDTKIKVEYEWAPIMGGQATFLGTRLEYNPGKNFSLGSSFLSQAAPSAGKIPSLGSSPVSHQMWEADLSLNFRPNLGSLWGGNFPVEVLFTGEVSRSNINPNTFGAAMLEDFSQSKLEDSLSLGKDSWRLGSRPFAVGDENQEQRDEVKISDEKLAGEKVNPSWGSDEITVLGLTYDFTSGASWDSVVCPLSPEGKDYSHMKYLEVWAKGVTSEVEVYIDIGVVSEDADGDGELDTEDKNGDGVLNPGEDTGIMIGDRLIGADNGKLDTEDVDGDGVLDERETENFSTFPLSDDYKQELSTEWCKYTIPLSKDTVGGVGWDAVKDVVKQVRIWTTGSNFSGELKFAKISLSGDRWQVENLEIKGVNNYDDPGFPNPFENSDFRSYYERMYGDTKTSQGIWQKEPALLMRPLSGKTSGHIQQTFPSARDFSSYRQIDFWIYQTQAQGQLYLKFGVDIEKDRYYSYTLPLSSASTNRWVKVEVPFSQLDTVGAPTFSNINQVRIGLREVTPSTPLYINDIYLNQVYKKQGQAQRYIIKTDWSKYLTLSYEYKKINPPFSVVGGSSTDQKLDVKRWRATLSLLDFLPLSYSGSEEYKSSWTTRGTDLKPVEKEKQEKRTQNYGLDFRLLDFLPLSYSRSHEYITTWTTEEGSLESMEEEVVEKNSQHYRLGFRLSSWPKLTFKGSNTTSDYLSKEPGERTFEDVYDLCLNYPVPLRFPLLPSNISTSYQLKKSGKEVKDTSTTVDITRKGSITLPFRPLPNMVVKTSYSQSETNHFVNEQKRPKSRSKNLSLTSRLSVFKLVPRISFEGGHKQEKFSSSDPEKRKVSTNAGISSTLPLRPASFIKMPEIFSTLGWYLKFGVERKGIYENTSVPLDDFSSQFGLGRLDLPDGREKLWLEKRTFNLRQSWRPFSFLTTSLSYGRQEKDKTESGTPYRIRKESWPVAELKFNLNETPLLIDRLSRRLFSFSHLVLEYSQKNTVKENISTATSIHPSLKWKGVFRKPENLSVTYSYKSSTNKKKEVGAPAASTKFSSTHKLGLDWSAYLPWGVKVPVLNRIINFKNRINLSTTLARELKYEETSSALVKQDQEKWTLGMNVSSKMTDNINMKLGLDLTYYQDKVKMGEDYLSYTGSARVEILF